MIKVLLCILIATGLLVGCKRKKQVVMPKTVALPPAAANAKPQTPQEALRTLNDVVTAYSMTHEGRAPSTLDQLVKEGVIREIPPLPPGRKFVLDKNGRVVIR
ncbi:MAG: hypothetical protein WCS99_05765 [Limisphaerales bacterium]